MTTEEHERRLAKLDDAIADALIESDMETPEQSAAAFRRKLAEHGYEVCRTATAPQGDAGEDISALVDCWYEETEVEIIGNDLRRLDAAIAAYTAQREQAARAEVAEAVHEEREASESLGATIEELRADLKDVTLRHERALKTIDQIEGAYCMEMDANRQLRKEAAFSIKLTPHEIQSNYDRVKFAEGLIRQLPENHDGRNTWLLNYAAAIRNPGQVEKGK
jgi:hypothetical protein